MLGDGVSWLVSASDMFISATISVFLFAVAFIQGQVDEDPECRPPHPPHKEALCCATPELIVQSGTQEIMHKCMEEAGMKPPRPPGPGKDGSPPPPPSAEEMAAHQSAHECLEECLFKNIKFVKSDGELDNDAIKATVTKMFTGDWADLASKTIDKCLASAKSEVGASAKCKSGSRQLVKCFSRAIFLNCPASAWTESADCSAAKARITKCPNAMVPMFRAKQ